MSEEVKTQRVITGKVVSNKMDKTIVVRIERQIKHSLYKKFIKLSSKVHAHDSANECNIGDIVKVKETKPMSKTKTWELVEVVTKAS
jgi:small subunit ribosomal protein S17